jgi:hypothetical protein
MVAVIIAVRPIQSFGAVGRIMNSSPATDPAFPVGLYWLMIISPSLLTPFDGVTKLGTISALRGWSMETVLWWLTLVDHPDLVLSRGVIRKRPPIIVLYVFSSEDHPHPLKCFLVFFRVVRAVFVEAFLMIL